MPKIYRQQYFWKTIKPYFSNAGLNSNNMFLEEKGELVSDETQLVFIMNKFFINVTKSLNIKENQRSPPVTLKDILKKFIFHPSIGKIEKTK